MFIRQPVVGQILKRGAASAVSSVESAIESSADHVLKTTRLPNGLLVCSLDREGGLSRLAVAFRAGTRYEADNERGICHRIRNSVGLGTEQSSAFDALWRAGALGSDLSTYLNRDLLVVQLSTYRESVLPALGVLGEIACQPGFRQWELEDSREFLASDLQYLNKDYAARANELFHRAAYRNGPLGHPLYVPSNKLGHRAYTETALFNFADNHLVSGDAAIVGINVDHEDLVTYAQDYAPVHEGKANQLPVSPYKGGEQMVYDYSTPFAHVLYGGKVAGLDNAADSAAAAVLAALIGSGPAVKWSGASGSTAAAKEASKALGGSVPFLLSTQSSAHLEQGLFGVYCVAEAAAIAPVLKAAHNALKNAAANAPGANELNAAKAKAAAHVLMRAEDSGRLLEDFVSQTLASGFASNPAELVDAVNKVSAADVQKVASQIVSKPSLAAVGNLDYTPHLDEL